MMFCVIFNSAATRRGGAAQEEKRSPTRTTARNPNVRSFTVTIPAAARGKRLKAARRESCRIIRHLGSGIVSDVHAVEMVQLSRARVRLTLVDEIITDRDWRAKAWYLERTWPEAFGPVAHRFIVKEVPQAPPPAPIITVKHVRVDENGNTIQQ
jgi:hypothetical protein